MELPWEFLALAPKNQAFTLYYSYRKKHLLILEQKQIRRLLGAFTWSKNFIVKVFTAFVFILMVVIA